MFLNTMKVSSQLVCTIGSRLGLIIAVVIILGNAVFAQNTFNSGSSGADGAFAPTTSQTIVVPASGVFNYTTVNIPSGVTITYTRNSANKPVTILASSDVTIVGQINIDGKPANANGGGGQNGPGGFEGGSGGYGAGPNFPGITGDGPGGGTGGNSTSEGANVAGGGGGGFAGVGANGGATNTVTGIGGPRYGTNAVSPLIGGSGGGGGGARASSNGGGGGGGAGAILIASSTRITFGGGISARGGSGGSGASNSSAQSGGGGGGGAGGAVRLVANSVSGGGYIYVSGSSGGLGGYSVAGGYQASGGTGAAGYSRIEAYDYSGFTGGASPAFISFSLPLLINSPIAPSLNISSVAGIAAPTNSLGSLHGVPDNVVPTSQTNPVTVVITGANIPVGTVVQVTLTPAIGTRVTANSTALAGTEAASTASASISIPNGTSVITAALTIDLTVAGNKNPIFMDGERVDRIELAATFGEKSAVTYITRSGRRLTQTSF